LLGRYARATTDRTGRVVVVVVVMVRRANMGRVDPIDAGLSSAQRPFRRRPAPPHADESGTGFG